MNELLYFKNPNAFPYAKNYHDIFWCSRPKKSTIFLQTWHSFWRNLYIPRKRENVSIVIFLQYTENLTCSSKLAKLTFLHNTSMFTCLSCCRNSRPHPETNNFVHVHNPQDCIFGASSVRHFTRALHTRLWHPLILIRDISLTVMSRINLSS